MRSEKIPDQDESEEIYKNMTRSQAFAILRETMEANLNAELTLTIRARPFGLKNSINTVEELNWMLLLMPQVLAKDVVKIFLDAVPL